MQNRILELEQQALRLQMNPHFLFNVLQTIRARMMEGDISMAESALQSFSKLVRKVLEHARLKTVELDDEITLLREYLAVEAFYHPKGFRYNIQVDSSDIDGIMVPPMLI